LDIDERTFNYPQYDKARNKIEMSKRGLLIWYTLKHYINSKHELEESGNISLEDRNLLSYIKKNAIELKGTFANVYLDFDYLENNKTIVMNKMMEFLKAIPVDESRLKTIVEQYVV
jgi:hypothetical protein